MTDPTKNYARERAERWVKARNVIAGSANGMLTSDLEQLLQEVIGWTVGLMERTR
jgi:hypothetical protein